MSSLASIRVHVGRAHDDAVVRVSLDMFLQILRTLEGFSTELALVRLQGNVNSDMGGDVVAFDGGSTALAPGTGQVEVVGRFTTDMAFADMLLYESISRGSPGRAGWVTGTLT